MGRYITGDIEHKFWFGVQSSDDANFFGVDGTEPSYLNYYFNKDNLKDINKGVKNCVKELGKYRNLLNKLFKKEVGYTNEDLAKYLKVDLNKVKPLLILFARLDLGLKIQKCVKETGSCEFEAEC